jgi:hypothetical protein
MMGLLIALSASMKTIIIVSRCTKIKKFSPDYETCEFHFKGVCAGEVLRTLQLKARRDFSIKKNEDYLMYVQVEKLEKGCLEGTILKVKNLEECWDRS